ncbi:MAG: AmmeMemoRadiSam system protein B [Sideroxydans sp.]
MTAIRPAAVAGTFYPAEAERLRQAVQGYLARIPQHALHPKALIVPHAGYVYSGSVAAAAYAALAPLRRTVRRVVLLGPTHRVAVRGIALPASHAFATPLGIVPLDRPGMAAIAGLPQVVESEAAHASEHSLEVQLPFLQTVLEDFTLLPLAVGHAAAEDVAEVLERVWGGNETLIVVSSDLSHYLPYEMAQQIDRHTVDGLLKLRPVPSHEEACGATPVNGLILAARRHGLVPHLLDLKNSGDTAGPRDGVVGYAALALCEEKRHVAP